MVFTFKKIVQGLNHSKHDSPLGVFWTFPYLDWLDPRWPHIFTAKSQDHKRSCWNNDSSNLMRSSMSFLKQTSWNIGRNGGITTVLHPYTYVHSMHNQKPYNLKHTRSIYAEPMVWIIECPWLLSVASELEELIRIIRWRHKHKSWYDSNS